MLKIELERENDALKAKLFDLEWCGYDEAGVRCCPECYHECATRMHHAHCGLARLLKRPRLTP